MIDWTMVCVSFHTLKSLETNRREKQQVSGPIKPAAAAGPGLSFLGGEGKKEEDVVRMDDG